MKKFAFAVAALLSTTALASASTFDTTRNTSGFNTFSNGNLTDTGSAGTTAGGGTDAYTTLTHSSGKWVARFTVGACGTPNTGDCAVGFGDATAGTGAGSYLGADTHSVGVYDQGQVFIGNNNLGNTVPSLQWGNGDVLDLVIDLTNKTLQVSKNGGALSNAFDISALASFTLSPGVFLGTNSDAYTFNGATPGSFTGAAAWDSSSGHISLITLTKQTFAPNTANATIGTLSDTHSGSGTPTFSVTDSSTCGINITGGTTLRAGATPANCGPNIYNGVTITDTIATFDDSPFTWCTSGCAQNGLGIEAQAVTAINPVFTAAGNSFEAAKPNALLGTVTSLTLNPSTPTPPGVLSITGANACHFHLSSTALPSQVLAGSQAGGCTVTGGGAGGPTYTDWNLVFTPTNTDIAAKTVAEGATAIGPTGVATSANGTSVNGQIPEQDGMFLGGQTGQWKALPPVAGPKGDPGPPGAAGTPGTNAGQQGIFTPSSVTATCTQGQSGFGPGRTDTGHMYIYVCDAANHWSWFGASSTGSSLP